MTTCQCLRCGTFALELTESEAVCTCCKYHRVFCKKNFKRVRQLFREFLKPKGRTSREDILVQLTRGT